MSLSGDAEIDCVESLVGLGGLEDWELTADDLRREGYGSGFRFCGLKCGVTFPRCKPWAELSYLVKAIHARYPLQDYLGCTENHADGGLHVHLLLVFKTKVDTTNCRFLDVLSPAVGSDEFQHPNILKGAPRAEWSKYITKEGFGRVEYSDIKMLPSRKRKSSDDWAEAVRLATCGDVRAAVELLWASQPRAMLMQGDRVIKMLRLRSDTVNGRGAVRYYGPHDENCHKLMQEVMRGPSAIILEGDAGTRKTQTMLAMADWYADSTIHVKGPIDSMKQEYVGQQLIVFDDISPMSDAWWGLGSWNSLFDYEHGGSVNLRNAPVTLRPGPRLFLTNGDLTSAIPYSDALWRRFKVVKWPLL